MAFHRRKFIISDSSKERDFGTFILSCSKFHLFNKKRLKKQFLPNLFFFLPNFDCSALYDCSEVLPNMVDTLVLVRVHASILARTSWLNLLLNESISCQVKHELIDPSYLKVQAIHCEDTEVVI